MDVEILNQKDEPMLKRKSFEAKVVFEGGTPSRINLKKKVSEKLSSKEDLTVIRGIKNDYGSERAMISGFVYADEDTKQKIENKYVKLRHLTKSERNAEKEKMKAAKQAAAAAKKK